MPRATTGVWLVALVLLSSCGAEREAAAPPVHVARAQPAARHYRTRPDPKPEPSPASEQPIVEGDGLSQDQITPVVEQRFPAMRGCHTMEYGGGGHAIGGSMTVHLQISADGSVQSADIEESSFDNDSLDECVLGVAKAIHFPAAAAPTDFSWRFKFRAPPSASDSRRSSR